MDYITALSEGARWLSDFVRVRDRVHRKESEFVCMCVRFCLCVCEILCEVRTLNSLGASRASTV